MLSDKLNALAAKAVNGIGQCRIPVILAQLPNADAQALMGALKNASISERKICGALREEGIPISRDAVHHVRMCLRNPDICKCNINKFGEN